MKLTDRQQAVLTYISGYQDTWQTSPSFDEICAHSDLLLQRRFLLSPYSGTEGVYPQAKGKNRKRAIEVLSPVETRRFEFPLLGKVAAGAPIEAIEDVDVVEVPPSMAREGDCFVLQVKGVSMGGRRHPGWRLCGGAKAGHGQERGDRGGPW